MLKSSFFWAIVFIVLSLVYMRKTEQRNERAMRELFDLPDAEQPSKVELPPNTFIKPDTTRYKGKWVDVQ